MRPQVVLFGDSITQQSFRSGGWGAALADSYSLKVDVMNRGFGGYNTRWALFLLNHIFPLGSPTEAPVAATVFFGANDAALLGRDSERQHVPVEEYKENLRKIVLHLKKCSRETFVVLITPPPVDEEARIEDAISFNRSEHADKAAVLPERTNEVAGVYATACIQLAHELDIPYIDLWSKMQETEGWQQMYLSDGLHLTPMGNGLVYQEVQRVFSQHWRDAASMPYDVPHHSLIDGKDPVKAFAQHFSKDDASAQYCSASSDA